MELLEDKEKETSARTDSVEERIKKKEEEVKQNHYNITKNQMPIEATSEAVDLRSNFDTVYK